MRARRPSRATHAHATRRAAATLSARHRRRARTWRHAGRLCFAFFSPFVFVVTTRWGRQALELVGENGQPDANATKSVIVAARERGLLLLSCGCVWRFALCRR